MLRAASDVMTYTATTRRPKDAPGVTGPAGATFGRNVVLLGLTSMVTDISSEMITSILPLYLMFHLQVTPVAAGFVDGVQQGGAALARVASGVFTDRVQSHRLVAACGYGMSALCKLALLLVGSSSVGFFFATFVDRIGKGIRTSPRDALISLSAPAERLGAAFGVHRAFDTTGAMLGPLLAFGVLYVLPDAYDVVFVMSFGIAVLGVLVLLCFVNDPAKTPSKRAPRVRELFEPLARSQRYRALAFAAGALGLFTLSDNFVYLALQKRLEFSPTWLPLLYVATPLSYLLFAIPMGRIADRFGPGKIIAAGYTALLLVYALVLLGPGPGSQSMATLASCIVLLGLYYAGTDGVLMAVTAKLLPPQGRATGMAVVTTCLGAGKLCAGIGFGVLWSRTELHVALMVFALGLMTTVLVSTVALWRTIAGETHD
jgi:MFS family permease